MLARICATKIRMLAPLLVALAGTVVAGCVERDTTPIYDDGTSVPGAASLPLGLQPGSPGRGAMARGPAEALSITDYALGSNDRLRIIVFGEERLTGEYTLDGDGNLAFPLIGQVSANGITAKQLERAISDKLQARFVTDPSVTVEVLTRRPVYVVGEVTKPGTYPHSSKMNVLTAVATAGGYTTRARQDSFYLKRTDKDGRLYRVRASQETVVQPGDVVEVKERYF